ncbi:pro-sigmaK processing inhibitor BofA family protein [Natrinema gelatinilyticum]|uniref:pro-sigmaK processing inhibitor BofA family protein n=1 Tax=Natrinema gelatinilyticum TaxID=2961571 RepID=UPI0020C5003A|nr:pro-sigmaK processing inhibitor BofA family protein [Natrinema gelatinilyticum]
MTGLEVLLLVLVLVVVLGAAQIVQTVRPFLINAVVGLVVLYVAQVVFGVVVAVSPIVIAIVAIGGIPGSLLVILLSLFEVAFVL